MKTSTHMDCEGCGERFNRPPRLSQREWLARKFCGWRCPGRAAIAPTEGLSMARENAISIASQALHARIMHVFAKTADARGITINEAAVHMGMRP